MRVSASSIIKRAAETQPTPANARVKRAGVSSLAIMLRRSLASGLAWGLWGKLTAVPPAATPRRRTTNHYLVCALSWAVPGAAHLWLGRRKGLVFLVVLPL